MRSAQTRKKKRKRSQTLWLSNLKLGAWLLSDVVVSPVLRLCVGAGLWAQEHPPELHGPSVKTEEWEQGGKGQISKLSCCQMA